MVVPFGVALDTMGNIYIADQGKPKAGCRSKQSPAILVFPPYNKKIPYTKPIREIQGCNTLLHAPTDIKVNKDGTVYVADTTKTGAGIIYFFAAGSGGPGNHDVKPIGYYTSPGAVTGIGIVP